MHCTHSQRGNYLQKLVLFSDENRFLPGSHPVTENQKTPTNARSAGGSTIQPPCSTMRFNDNAGFECHLTTPHQKNFERFPDILAADR